MKETDYKGYFVTKDGRIWSEKSNKYMAQRVCNGYANITLKEKVLCVHRLVAKAYIPTDDTSLVINHKDSNKLNNHVDNLEWCTQKENVHHHGKDVSHPRRVIQMTLKGEVIAIHNSLTEAGNAIGRTRHAVQKVCKGDNNTAGGFVWKYENDDFNDKEIDDEEVESKQIEDYPNYLVFKDGRIYNTKRKSFLKPIKNASGYSYVTLCSPNGDKKKSNFYIQQVVAKHYIPNPHDKKIVNFKDKDKTNFNADNLVWA